jgi:hypothetical protein
VNILFKPEDDPYAVAITHFVEHSFPQLGISSQTQLEGILAVFLGTKNCRLGPMPNIESQVEMLKVIRSFVTRSLAIPVLIPGAAVKVPPRLDASLDLAEVSVMKTLMRLQQQVKVYYIPGFHFVYRAEDLTEYVISEHVQNLDSYIDPYVEGMRKLARILSMDYFQVQRESQTMQKDEFINRVHTLTPYLLDYLERSTGLAGSYPTGETWLRKQGFNGLISPEARSYYYERYRKHYPNMHEADYRHELAKYMSSVITRVQLHGIGVEGPHLEIAMVPSSPDMPKVTTRVMYRTVPLNHTERHIMPWNAKGILKINEQGNARIALLHWWDKDTVVHEGKIVLRDGDEELAIQAGYVLE